MNYCEIIMFSFLSCSICLSRQGKFRIKKEICVYINITLLFYVTTFLFHQVAMLFDKLRFSMLIWGELTETFYPRFLFVINWFVQNMLKRINLVFKRKFSIFNNFQILFLEKYSFKLKKKKQDTVKRIKRSVKRYTMPIII